VALHPRPGLGPLRRVDVADVARALDIARQHRDLEIGVTDASLVVLSERHETVDVLTLDHRHFRTVPGSHGRPFRILAADPA
jgi:predicted nucleic acid-binding protein